jgi:hypothetical protein
MVPWVLMPRLPAASRAAVSSVNKRPGRCSSATRSASHSPVCKLNTCDKALSSAETGRCGDTRIKRTAGCERTPGRCLATSRQTASGTSTELKSANRSSDPTSSRWISGPASQTTSGACSLFAMQAPLHVVHDKGFGHPGGMGFEETAQCVGQQFVKIRRPACFHVGPCLSGEFRRQFRLDQGVLHGEKLARAAG